MFVGVPDKTSLALYAAKTIQILRKKFWELYLACALSRVVIRQMHFMELAKECD